MPAFFHDNSKLVPEITHRATSFTPIPLALLPQVLDVPIPVSRHKDVRISPRLHQLMFSEQLNHLDCQRDFATVSIFDVPLPGRPTVWFRRDMNLLPGKVDILPSGIKQFTTTHPGAECGENEDLPPKWSNNLRLSCRLHQPGTLIFTEGMNGPLGYLGFANMVEGILFQLAPFYCQLEQPLQRADLLGNCGGPIASVKACLEEPLTVFVQDAEVIDITNYFSCHCSKAITV